MLARPRHIPLILARILCCSAFAAGLKESTVEVLASGAVGITQAQTQVVRRVKNPKRRWNFFSAAQGKESNVSTALAEIEAASQQNHIYEGGKKHVGSSPSNCHKYEGPVPHWRGLRTLWTGIVAAKEGQSLYGTGWAQHYIYNHQNPLDCTNKSFLIYEDQTKNGLGSHIHVLSHAMKIAMDLDRILVFDPSPTARQTFASHYDETHCPGAKSLECWFKPLSECKPGAGSDVMRITDKETVDKLINACVESEELCNAVQKEELHQAPKVFTELLDSCSTIQPEKKFYWWRAQSAAYITRLNNNTRLEMNKLRQEILQVYHGATKQTDSFYRLPEGTIAAHVRHGDKFMEAELHPSIDYLNVATKFAKGDQSISVIPEAVAQNSTEKFKYDPRKFAGRSLWVATDDANVVETYKKFASGLGDAKTWDIYFANITRKGKHIGEGKTVRRKVLETLVDVELCLQADAFVVTLNSNLGRLVDELRMTTMRKASNPLVTVSVSCPPWMRRGSTLGSNSTEISVQMISKVGPCYLDY